MSRLQYKYWNVYVTLKILECLGYNRNIGMFRLQ